jgi:hypothetical protein
MRAAISNDPETGTTLFQHDSVYEYLEQLVGRFHEVEFTKLEEDPDFEREVLQNILGGIE